VSIWKYKDLLIDLPPAMQVSLGEGSTPLVRSRGIGPKHGLKNLLFKIESSNPTGSYKDRFAAAAISDMLANGRSRCIATSSGNTGSALAAYCAVAQIDCRIVIVETTPTSKLKQMLCYGARLARVKGFGLDSAITANTMEQLKKSTGPDSQIQISAFAYSPHGMSGVQTISYELCNQMPAGIDHVFSPAGGGGLTLAVARGFALLVDRGILAKSPAIECVQPQGNDTIASSLRGGCNRAREVVCTSQISGLQVPNVIDGDHVIAMCRASGGSGHTVSDEEAWAAQTMLSNEEGLLCEPAAATALAGALRARAEGKLNPDATIICLVTGAGFKDPVSIDRMIGDRGCPAIDLSELRNWLETR